MQSAWLRSLSFHKQTPVVVCRLFVCYGQRVLFSPQALTRLPYAPTSSRFHYLQLSLCLLSAFLETVHQCEAAHYG